MHDGGPVWVTGAGGFLGAAVCRKLVDEGFAVRPVLHRSDGGARLASLADSLLPPLVGDLDAHGATVLASVPAPVTLVHLAARIPAGSDVAEAERTAASNRRIDDNVFRAAARFAAGVVYASSGSVYGAGRGQLFTEQGPTAPELPYAEAKLRSERVGADMLDELPFVALRISAPYGPGQTAATVVRMFLTRALNGENLRFHGSGSRMQDFVFVDDVAAAVARSVGRRARGVLNIASGSPVSMRQLADEVVRVTGAAVTVVPSGAPDPQEGRSADYSIDAAAADIGWRPETSLHEGLRRWCDRLRGGHQ